MELLERYWGAMAVYVKRPNILNKRIMGVSNLLSWKILPPLNNDSVVASLVNSKNLSDLQSRFANDVEEFELDLQDTRLYSSRSSVILVQKLFPRQPLKRGAESDKKRACSTSALLISFHDCAVSFFPIENESKLIPLFPYKLFLDNDRIELSVEVGRDARWLEINALPKLNQWLGERQSFSGSLTLISNEPYIEKYQYLKDKYAAELVAVWPESEGTDPIKFVYEDIAIAAYLLVLWSNERREQNIRQHQSFVDLGCGNGLLVYLLSNEGHQGVGIDVRKRKIWDRFSDIDLRERTFVPSDSSFVFPEYDWLIGNHSDELTPWIPYIAAKSAYTTRVFLLPCCTYDFTGKKYQRRDSAVSPYQCYLKYVNDICVKFGFQTQTDKLRIPSTKRICLVAAARSYHINKEDEMAIFRDEFIKQKMRDIDSFDPREKVEKVRNCTKIPREFLDEMVQIISDRLMEKSDSAIPLTLQQVAEIIGRDKLVRLKCQFGGLQTFLRNHHHIFQSKPGTSAFFHMPFFLK